MSVSSGVYVREGPTSHNLVKKRDSLELRNAAKTMHSKNTIRNNGIGHDNQPEGKSTKRTANHTHRYSRLTPDRGANNQSLQAVSYDLSDENPDKGNAEIEDDTIINDEKKSPYNLETQSVILVQKTSKWSEAPRKKRSASERDESDSCSVENSRQCHTDIDSRHCQAGNTQGPSDVKDESCMQARASTCVYLDIDNSVDESTFEDGIIGVSSTHTNSPLKVSCELFKKKKRAESETNGSGGNRRDHKKRAQTSHDGNNEKVYEKNKSVAALKARKRLNTKKSVKQVNRRESNISDEQWTEANNLEKYQDIFGEGSAQKHGHDHQISVSAGIKTGYVKSGPCQDERTDRITENRAPGVSKSTKKKDVHGRASCKTKSLAARVRSGRFEYAVGSQESHGEDGTETVGGSWVSKTNRSGTAPFLQETRVAGAEMDTAVARKKEREMPKDLGKSTLSVPISDTCSRRALKRIQCHMCDATFYKHTNLMYHLQHHDQPRFKCEICNKTYGRKETLTAHRKLHTGDSSVLCNLCGKNLKSAETFASHMRIHTGEKPYSCEICSSSFRQHSALVSHSRVHTKERPFQCNVCSKTYRFQKNLYNHRYTHTGERPYACPICKADYYQAAALSVHLKVHSGERPFACPLCKMRFGQKSHLNKHMRCVHFKSIPMAGKMCLL